MYQTNISHQLFSTTISTDRASPHSTYPTPLTPLHLPHSTVALLLSHVPVDVVARNIQLILVGKGFQVMFSGVV